jgi:hypothetical protein
MHKWFIGLVALILLRDPAMAFFVEAGITGEHVAALAIALVVTPWVARQIDG